jgi:sugar phosphate isomerase/epimerase
MKPFAVTAFLLLALGTAPLRAEDAAQPLRLNYRAMDRLGWKLSCQAWTFREMSAFETIDTVHNLGIRYIEFFPGQRFSKEKPDAKLDHTMSPELIAELQQKLKDANVTAVNYGVVGLGNNEAEARKVFDWAKKMGLLTIVSEPDEAAMPMLDRLCQEYGINIAIHDHPKPSHYWNPESVLKVSEGRSRRIGSCSDVGHWYRSGLVPIDCLKQLEGRIISLHFKDLSEAKEDVPWGTGKCDARGMLEELKRQGVRPVISIEYESGSGAPLLANVTKCVEWFNTTVTELAKKK